MSLSISPVPRPAGESHRSASDAAGFNLTFADFLATSTPELLGRLSALAANDPHATRYNEEHHAWEAELRILRSATEQLIATRDDASTWRLLLEYRIPRRSKRVDCVVLARSAVLVLEFKIGATSVDRSATWQVEDYALDLRDFHAHTRSLAVFAAVVATGISPQVQSTSAQPMAVAKLNGALVAGWIGAAVDEMFPGLNFDGVAWEQAPYSPTPTIVEATQRLFSGHSVSDLSHHYADNLQATVQAIVREVARAREHGERLVCFVTGVPGAGKTLTGLEAVHQIQAELGTSGVASFLSGNGPLVKILREAIARDAVARARAEGEPLLRREADRRAEGLVQNVHVFVDYHGIKRRDSTPPEGVVVYDEAQRAWNAAQVERFHKQPLGSEASLILQVMARRPGWGAVIAVVGGGQEINTGEAGLEEWGRAIGESAVPWRVVASPHVLTGDASTAGHRLFSTVTPKHITPAPTQAMHLDVSVRSPRAQHLAKWVDAVLRSDAEAAHPEIHRLIGFRIGLTRSLDAARAWLRDASRADRRPGLVASSGSLRHRAYGLEMDTAFHRKFPFEHWFLDEATDVRSSYSLEVALTEFECQGLELDYVGLCWGDDLTINAESGWEPRDFRGSRWQQIRDEQRIRYLINKYRVLLTRAREGIVIWIPPGSPHDPTRDPAKLDRTANFLMRCGVPTIS